MNRGRGQGEVGEVEAGKGATRGNGEEGDHEMVGVDKNLAYIAVVGGYVGGHGEGNCEHQEAGPGRGA